MDYDYEMKHDLNEVMARAEAYERAQERIGDLAAQLHDAHQTIKRLGEELEAAEAREAELIKAINDAYPTIAGHVISLEKAGEAVAHEQWAKLARQLYEATRDSKR